MSPDDTQPTMTRVADDGDGWLPRDEIERLAVARSGDCDAVDPTGVYECTLDAGHATDHVGAGVVNVYARWPNAAVSPTTQPSPLPASEQAIISATVPCLLRDRDQDAKPACVVDRLGQWLKCVVQFGGRAPEVLASPGRHRRLVDDDCRGSIERIRRIAAALAGGRL